MRLNSKVAKKLRHKANELTKGQPKVEVYGGEAMVPRVLMPNCTRYVYQTLKYLYKDGTPLKWLLMVKGSNIETTI